MNSNLEEILSLSDTLNESSFVIQQANKPIKNKTLEVGPSSHYNTINDAISNSNAGDTILINSGTYNEHLNISRPLFFQANGKVTISQTEDDIVEILTNYVSFEGIDFRVDGEDSKGFCVIALAGFIQFDNCTFTTRQTCCIESSPSAIICCNNCKFTGVQTLLIKVSSKGHLYLNKCELTHTSTESRDPLLVLLDNTVTTIHDCLISNGSILFQNEARGLIKNTTFSGTIQKGIITKPKSMLLLINCDLSDCQNCGLFFEGIEGIFENCKFNNNNEIGAFCVGGEKLIFRNCEFYKNKLVGIVLRRVQKSALLNCTFNESGSNGIQIEDCNYSFLTNTTIRNNGRNGFVLTTKSEAKNNIYIDNCTITENQSFGGDAEANIILYVRNSTFKNNETCGITLSQNSQLYTFSCNFSYQQYNIALNQQSQYHDKFSIFENARNQSIIVNDQSKIYLIGTLFNRNPNDSSIMLGGQSFGNIDHAYFCDNKHGIVGSGTSQIRVSNCIADRHQGAVILEDRSSGIFHNFTINKSDIGFYIKSKAKTFLYNCNVNFSGPLETAISFENSVAEIQGCNFTLPIIIRNSNVKFIECYSNRSLSGFRVMKDSNVFFDNCKFELFSKNVIEVEDKSVVNMIQCDFRNASKSVICCSQQGEITISQSRFGITEHYIIELNDQGKATLNECISEMPPSGFVTQSEESNFIVNSLYIKPTILWMNERNKRFIIDYDVRNIHEKNIQHIELDNVKVEKNLGYSNLSISQLVSFPEIKNKFLMKTFEIPINNSVLTKYTNIKHPFLVPIITYNEKSVVYPFYRYGNIREVVSNEKFANMFNSTMKSISIVSLASAIECLHKNDILHCNICPSSILVNKHFELVLSQVSMVYDYGDPLYFSPEQFSNANLTKATDVYSFALTVLFLLDGKDPFGDINKLSYPFERINGIIPDLKKTIELSDEFTNLLIKCLDKNPLNRPSIKDIMEYIKRIHYNVITVADKEKVKSFCERFGL
ncbi:serine/threonine protein kinase [Histomonas meleagridis]|uniref:serine/threonine protein kinase n=1 Tax=Histomonas meleagridis TaxID=135588 RepID=UPI0035598585|nr:serine/threonine protein kinase [Histomonas meleagridis]KAH0801030.1 serine/threonine protein kinase [Histomonas meleagridis]